MNDTTSYEQVLRYDRILCDASEVPVDPIWIPLLCIFYYTDTVRRDIKDTCETKLQTENVLTTYTDYVRSICTYRKTDLVL